MRLSEYAKLKKICYMTAYNHYHKGLIPNAHQLESGVIVVEPVKEFTVLYCYAKNKEEIQDQLDRLITYCKDNELSMNNVVKEITDDFFNRPLFLEILNDKKVTHIIIEDSDKIPFKINSLNNKKVTFTIKGYKKKE